MLVKVRMKDGTTVQYDSREQPIAVILEPQDKEAVEKLGHNDSLLVSGPAMSNPADIVAWAQTGWKGVMMVPAGVPLVGRPQ